MVTKQSNKRNCHNRAFSAHYAVVFSMYCCKLTVLPIAAIIMTTFCDPIDFNPTYDQDTYG